MRHRERHMELGLQSYCLRGIKDNAQVAQTVKQCGLQRIEVCGVHTTWDDPAAFGALADQYRDAGVPIVSIGVNRIGTDREVARKLFDCAAAARLSRMSVDFPLDGIDEALAVAEEHTERTGIVLGIHNHGGRHWLGSSTALKWVFGKTSRRIGLNLDTAWALDSGENPIAMIAEFAERLHLLHIKDFVFDSARSPEDVVVGTGNIHLRKLDEALSDAGFDGEAILEYEGDPANPVPAIRECVTAVGEQMALVTRPHLPGDSVVDE
jgi:sugar phosphate isomerase/epimerase